MGNAVVYFEVGAADEAALKRFYAELFDWQIEPFGGNYSSIDTRAGSGINGGIGRSSDGTPWASFYVEVDDPQVVLDKAASLGGKTVVPVTEIPNVLTWAMLSDPDGLLIGLFKSSGALRLQPSVGSGAPIDWFEVLGSDGERTRAFYSNLFGWQAGGAGPYLMVDTGAGRGIQGGLGDGGGSMWATVYAHVPDVAATLARAEQLGGRREYGPNQVDDHMQTGALRDPAGNVIGIYEHQH